MSASESKVIDLIRAERVIALLRKTPEVDGVVDALVAGGVVVVEVTMESDDADGTISRLRGRGDVTVLAGTIRSVEDAERAMEAGAEACVLPATLHKTVAWCVEHRVPVIPGAFTPTEVAHAWELGASLVKLFPGSALGPGYVKALLEPLHDVPLVVTGGITAENAPEFLRAGAVAVGTGSLARAADPEAAARGLLEAVRFASR